MMTNRKTDHAAIKEAIENHKVIREIGRRQLIWSGAFYEKST